METTPYRPETSGSRAIAGAIMAVVGVLAAANPGNPVLRALNEAVPQIASAVPTLITACGALLAAFSHPPKLGGRAGAGSGR